MRILSRSQIEGMSRKLLGRYLGIVREQERHIDRIDPADFAREMIGVEFRFRYLPGNGVNLGLSTPGEVDVYVMSEDGETELFALNRETVLIDRSLLQPGQEGRRHFTMMHETAHQILSAMYPSDYADKTVLYCKRETDRKDWCEWQADALASCLLLPRELVVKHLTNAGIHGRIGKLNRVFAPREYERFSRAANALGVSKTALAIRLTHLGMLGRNDLNDPYALADIFPS